MIVSTQSTENRERLLAFGSWLMAIGALFLVKDQMRWDWSEAWPLWVIAFGAAGTVTSLLTLRHGRLGFWNLGWSVFILALGVVLLLSTTRAINLTAVELLAWWPVAVIAIGVWFLIGAIFVRGRTASDEVAIPLAGLTQAQIKLNFGGGELTLGEAQQGMLVSGRFEGGVRERIKGDGRIELSPIDPGVALWAGRPLRWEVGITPAIPVDLSLHTGANRSRIDLSRLRLRRLELQTGVSETNVRLPATGQTSVRVGAGVASVVIEVPQGVAARIRGKVALGAMNIDETRFPRSFDSWVSSDFETATNRMEIEIDGGLGSVRVA